MYLFANRFQNDFSGHFNYFQNNRIFIVHAHNQGNVIHNLYRFDVLPYVYIYYTNREEL